MFCSINGTCTVVIWEMLDRQDHNIVDILILTMNPKYNKLLGILLLALATTSH